MKFKLASEHDGRTFVLILDQGEEAFGAITAFANEKAIKAASVAAIGAFESAKVGWFDLAAKRYNPISVDEQCEVLSLLGDIAQGDDGKASLHLHAVLGLRDGSVRGGHFLGGKVRPTLEVTIIGTASGLRRKRRADLGIALVGTAPVPGLVGSAQAGLFYVQLWCNYPRGRRLALVSAG